MDNKNKKRKHNPAWKDNTITQRGNKRNALKDEIARAAGWSGWSEFTTAAINQQVIIPRKPV